MTQPRWRDPEAPATYHDAPGSYKRPPSAAGGPEYHRGYDAGGEEETRILPPSRARATRRWGMLPGRFGVCVVIGSAALGGLVTALTHREPGAVLGVFLIAGTIAAALAVRPRAGYLIIPVPALAYLVAAMIAGLIHDRGNDASLAALAINATQWIAGGFIAMAAATGLAILITAARWRRKPQS